MPSQPSGDEREVEIGPVDHSHEAPAIEALRRRGFTVDFVADGDRLRISGTNRRLRPEDVSIRDHYRFEGTSDPDDMSVIYAIEARDGTRGVLIDGFGAYADPAVARILERVAFARRPARRPRRLLSLTLGAIALTGVAVMAYRRRAA